MRAPQQPTDVREAAIDYLRGTMVAVPVRSVYHGAELIEYENLAILPNAPLPEDHRACGIQANSYSGQSHQREGQNQSDGGENDRSDALIYYQKPRNPKARR